MFTFYLSTIFVFDTKKYKPITDSVFFNIVESFNLLLFSKSVYTNICCKFNAGVNCER